MRFAILAAGVAAIITVPASATVVSLANNVDLSGGAQIVRIGGNDATYTFSYTAGSSSPISIAMTGTGQVYGNGFFSQNAADPLQLGTLVPDQLSLGQFFQVSGTQPIAYSIALVNIALRFATAGQTYYGYAQVAGSSLVQFAYNNTPGASITTGQAIAPVPEAASWMMMIAGFGLVGGALRRARIAVRFAS